MEKKGNQKNKEAVKVKKGVKATQVSTTNLPKAAISEKNQIKTTEAKISTAAAPTPVATKSNNSSKSLKKEYIENGNKCKVTFTLPKEAAIGANSVHLVGQFNGWSEKSTAMKKQKNGDFTVTIDLNTGREYEFRYLIDENKWENDWNADKYIWSELGAENSVVIV